ncbi:MAG TPA: hypothetical protein VGM22_23540 [Methylomirabilota bacterium]|jgi:hypothetical protein
MRGATLALGLLILTGCAETTRPVESSRPNPASGPLAVIHYGGHRAKALELVKQAEGELREAVAYAQAHPQEFATTPK